MTKEHKKQIHPANYWVEKSGGGVNNWKQVELKPGHFISVLKIPRKCLPDKRT
jgi:hypothetical protein